MEKKKKTKIRKWDEVGGAVETEIEEVAGSFDETPGASPSVSRNPMRGIEYLGGIHGSYKTDPLT